MAGLHEFEAARRRRISEVSQARRGVGSSEYYSYEFFSAIERSVSIEWQVSGSQEGVRFIKNFPYDTRLYDMRGWDALQLAVTLDLGKRAVALRLHAYDQQADMTIEEGTIVTEGKVVSFADEASVGFSRFQRQYEQILRDIQGGKESTSGDSGCAFDHLSGEIGRLPSVRELMGNTYGKVLAEFMREVKNGKLDPKTMPSISLGWPLTTPYHSAQDF